MVGKFVVTKDAYINGNVYMSGNMTLKPYEYHTTKQYNSGAAPELRSDGAFVVPILGFNLNDLRGKRIKNATLLVHWIHNPVREWDIGTISHDWEEGTGKGHTSVKIDGVSLWHYAKDKRWPENGTYNEFVMGNQNSRHFLSLPATIGDRQEIPLDPLLVYSLVYGENFGLVLYDTRADIFTHQKGWDYYSKPKWLHSRTTRDKGKEPCLVIEYEAIGAGTVPEITGLEAAHHPGISLEKRGIKLSWQCKNCGDFTRFDISINGKKLDRYRVPVWDNRDGCYEALLYDCAPSALHTIEVSGCGLWGSGRAATVSIETTPARKRLKVAKINPVNKEKPLVLSVKGLKVYAYDEFHKIDPRSGALCTNAGLSKTHANTLVRNKSVCLRAGLNETIGFQLVFESQKGGHFSLIPFGESIPPMHYFRVWYHKDKTAYYPDALVPLSPAHFSFPSTDNKVPGQRFQAVYVEIQLAEYGAITYDFSLAVHCSGVVVGWIPVKLEVQNFRLEDSADFIFEMNHYNSPSASFGKGRPPRAAASDEEVAIDFNFYRMAHDHWADLDIIAYNAFGEICADAVPLLEGEGASIRVKDWTPFDRKYGPLLSGSAFAGCGRTSRVKQIYLPFFECWPLPLQKYYKIPVNEKQEYLTVMNEHRSKETYIERDFDPAYRQGIKNILREFILHFEEKGWTDVVAFYFFNNKYYWRGSPFRNGKDVSSWWLLDEPFYYSDWRALRFFGSMLSEVKQELGGRGKNFLFRIDVSWQSQYHHLDHGILDINVTSAKNGLDNGSWYRKRALLYNERFWKYGEGNPLNEPDTNTYANIMRHYAWHGEGFLPWNSVSANDSFDEANPVAIIYHGMRFGVKGPVGSLRLKTIRRVMQDLQYVHQAAVKQGIDRIAEGDIINSLITTEATAHMQNTLAAGSTRSEMKIWEPAVLRESLRRYL